MVFWGQVQNYMMRVNVSLLIVAMVTSDPPKNETFITCPENRNWMNSTQISESSDANEGKFDWDALTRGYVLAAFGIGYVTTQIIGGRMAEKYGFKKVYGFGLLLTACLTFLSPVVANLHVWAFFVLRLFQGMFEGVTFPALQAMIVRWIPQEERNSFMARSFFGSVFGVVITFPLCGILIEKFGWESAFYVIGSITCVWFLFWWFLVFDSPDKHPRIKVQEKQYILHQLSKTLNVKSKPIPWKSILTSIPIWGMIITGCGNDWGFSTLGTNGPTYMKYILGVDIKTNGILSALPMLSRYIGGMFHGAIADFLLRKKYLSVLWVRRIFNSLCMVGPGLVMIIMAYPPSGTECNTNLVVILFCIGMFFNGAISSGHFASPGDLAPNYAGTIFGFFNTITGGSIGFIVPVFIGAITRDSMNFESWAIVFATSAAMYFVTNVFYFFMISGEIQSWNNSTVSVEGGQFSRILIVFFKHLGQ